MVQYHPTTLAGIGLLITEGARGEGAHLYNAQGERFMEKYAPNKMELASRDVVSRAEQTEIDEGRGLPRRHRGAGHHHGRRAQAHPRGAARDRERGPRLRRRRTSPREPIHIKPGNHYVMGGVKTDIDGQTEVPGLYAAGECACVSVHGGNRLGANSLLDTLIFGRRSGEHAARDRKGHGHAHARRRGAGARARPHRRDRVARPHGPAHLRDQGRAGQDDGRQGVGVPRRGPPAPGARGRQAPPGGGQDRGRGRQGLGVQPGRARARWSSSSCSTTPSAS